MNWRAAGCLIAIPVIWFYAMAYAQTVSTSGASQDLTPYAKTTDLPQPCGTVPSPDTLNGTVGSGGCFTRPTDTRPTVVQAATVTTNGSGVFTVTWAKTFATTNPFINAQPINPSGSQPYICNITSSTATAVTGQCWQTLTMTLPSIALSLLGLVLNPTGVAASISVRVAGRDLTQ